MLTALLSALLTLTSAPETSSKAGWGGDCKVDSDCQAGLVCLPLETCDAEEEHTPDPGTCQKPCKTDADCDEDTPYCGDNGACYFN